MTPVHDLEKQDSRNLSGDIKASFAAKDRLLRSGWKKHTRCLCRASQEHSGRGCHGGKWQTIHIIVIRPLEVASGLLVCHTGSSILCAS